MKNTVVYCFLFFWVKNVLLSSLSPCLFLSERRDRERAARMENLRQQGGGGKTAAGLNKDQKPINGPSGAQYNAHSE